MLTPEGKVTTEEMYDMQESVLTGPDHLMLSGESTYGAQAGTCVELEAKIQREICKKIEK